MTTWTSTLRMTALAAVAIAVGVPGAQAQTRNCWDTLVGMRDFSRFVTGVAAARVSDDVRFAREITIFAVTNDGVRRSPPHIIDVLFPVDDSSDRRADRTQAGPAVAAHVINGRHDAATLAKGGQFTSVAGTPLVIAASGSGLTVQGANTQPANITMPDIACSNGVIHGVDRLLLR